MYVAFSSRSKIHHFEHVGNVMSSPERSISRLSHVKSTWAFFCNEMAEVGGDSWCSFLRCRSVREIAK